MKALSISTVLIWLPVFALIDEWVEQWLVMTERGELGEWLAQNHD